MKFLIAFAAILVLTTAARSYLDAPVLDNDLINKINADNSIPWTAGRNDHWEGVSRRDARRFLGTLLGQHPNATRIPMAVETNVASPSSFDSRTHWSQCNIAIRNQKQCGSCWTFGAAEEFTWRRCISGLTPYDMTEQYILSCDTGGYGCSGGYINQVQDYLASTGTSTITCLAYTSGGGSVAPCPSTCTNGDSIKLYQQQSGSVKQFSSVSAIKAEVSTNGPVEAGFSVYSDFFNYKSGVYVRSPSATLEGGHAIIIIGYGHDSVSGLDYWLCSNSWGGTWGMSGYFMIKQGTCGMETQVYSGCPAGGSACQH